MSAPVGPSGPARAIGRLRRTAGAVRRAASRRLRPGGGDARPAWATTGFDPWTPLAPAGARHCNICRWSGDAFEGPLHCEAAVCPQCGSIGRDRFLFWALQHRIGRPPGAHRLRVLETSPRLDDRYRQAMDGWFDYLCSDFDERAHAGMIRIDLQAIDLPGGSLDVILTPHVLEHVPDTDRAIRELFRVLRPGGRLLLQVPLLQERTAPPAEPEFHGDDTPVCWRFGPELGDELRRHGFEIELLATEPLLAAAAAPPGTARPWPLPVSPEFDAEGLLRGLRRSGPRPADHNDPRVPLRPELHLVADAASAVRYGFEPAYMFLTWSARKPDQA